MKSAVVSLGIVLPGVLPAQQILTAVASERIASQEERTERMKNPLVTTLTVDLANVPLEMALSELSRRSGVSVVYSRTLLPMTRRVSVQGKDITLELALRQALRGTGMAVQMTPGGQVTIGREGSANGIRRVQGTIVGKVVHAKTKQPVRGATVVLDNASGGVTTAEDGTFRIIAEIGGRVVHVRAVGFVRANQRVLVREDGSTSIEIMLEPSANVLDEVVVTGSVVPTERKAIVTPITTISGEDLEKRGITRLDQLFRGEVPGVLVLEQGALSYATGIVGRDVTASVYARGATTLLGGPNPLKTYVDGVELLDPAYLGTIDPRSIDKIEIVVGPQAGTVYGSGAMGGVMQIFTKKGISKAAEVRFILKYGALQNNFSSGWTPQHNDAILVSGGIGPELTYSGTVTYDYLGQWQPKLFSRRSGASLGMNHVRDRLNISASASATGSTQGTWADLTGEGYGLREYASGPEGWYFGSDINTVYASEQVSTSSSQTISLNLDYRVTPAWRHSAVVGRSQNTFTLKPVSPNYIRNQIGSDTLYGMLRTAGQRLTWNYHTAYMSTWQFLSSSITVGANGSTGDRVSISGCQTTPVASAVVGCAGGTAPIVTVPLNDRNWGSFAQWQVGFWRQLYSTFGVRFEQNPNYGRDIKFDVTPTNGLAYTIERGDISLKLLGSYGRATRPPPADRRLEVKVVNQNRDPESYISIFANPMLQPEYSSGPQGGIEFYYGNRGSFTLNHYQQTITNLIQRVRIDSFLSTLLTTGATNLRYQEQWQNVAKIRQIGWEGTGTANIGPVYIKSAYAWNDSRILKVYSPTFSSAPRPFYGVPTHTGHLQAGYAHGGTSMAFSVHYVGGTIVELGDAALYNHIYRARIPMYGLLAVSARGVVQVPRTISGYTKVDVSGMRQVTPDLTLTLNVVNAGNSYMSDQGRLNPSLGRQTTIGLSYRFNKR